MHHIARRARATAVAVAALGLAALAAEAQMREFNGRIDQIGPQQMVVESRRGDRVTFARVGATAVSGAKRSWAALAANDRVTVSWKLDDAPLKKAYTVVVLPPKGDGS